MQPSPTWVADPDGQRVELLLPALQKPQGLKVSGRVVDGEGFGGAVGMLRRDVEGQVGVERPLLVRIIDQQPSHHAACKHGSSFSQLFDDCADFKSIT